MNKRLPCKGLLVASLAEIEALSYCDALSYRFNQYVRQPIPGLRKLKRFPPLPNHLKTQIIQAVEHLQKQQERYNNLGEK
ncbi:unnamed protein product [Fasciola hepatica]|uniref:Uncharacterized protein n=1 Tax=Fasciola hepatica TaxID=6192 RepID=A0ABC9HHA0_FASHE